MKADSTTEQTKRKALLGLGAAVAITIGAWLFIDDAADRGLARLNHIDSVFAVCNVAYQQARTGADTSRIDAQPLSAAIDSGTTSAPHRCGDLRRPVDALAAQDSARRAQMYRSLMPTRDGR